MKFCTSGSAGRQLENGDAPSMGVAIQLLPTAIGLSTRRGDLPMVSSEVIGRNDSRGRLQNTRPRRPTSIAMLRVSSASTLR